MGYLALAKFPYLFVVSRFSRLQHHPGHDLFYESLIRYANHLDISYLRVCVEKFFNLSWRGGMVKFLRGFLKQFPNGVSYKHKT